MKSCLKRFINWIAYGLAIILIAVFVYEKHPSIYRRLFPPQYSWTQIDLRYLSQVCDAAQSQLRHKSNVLWAPKEVVSRVEYDWNTSSQRKSPIRLSFIWDAIGLLEFRTYQQKPEIEASLEHWASEIINDDGELLLPITTVDECWVGYVFMELYEATKKTKYRNAADKLAYLLLMEHNRTPSGLLPYREFISEIMFVDTLGMSCPFLARYGRIMNNPDAIELAVNQVVDYLQNGTDEKSGLPFHAYDSKTGEKLGVATWNRGIGWLLSGLVESLCYMPDDHPQKEFLKNKFQELVSTLGKYQNPDGGWYVFVNIRGRESETSGTAIISFAIEKGIRYGFLSKDTQKILDRSAKCLMSYTDQNGILTGAMSDCPDIGRYPRLVGPYGMVQGPALAFLTRYYRQQENAAK